MKAGSPGRPSERVVTVISGGEDTPIPEPPDSIDDTDTWDRLWTVGRGWLSNEAHYDLLCLIVESLQDRARLREAMASEPMVVAGSAGQSRVHPGLRAMDSLDQKIAKLLDAAGFSPERQKAVVTPKKGRLDALRAKKASQVSSA